MDTVQIPDLKSRLREHLRQVWRGHSPTVLDRDTRIARIVPYEEDGAPLTVRSLAECLEAHAGAVAVSPALAKKHLILLYCRIVSGHLNTLLRLDSMSRYA